jgi:hypothetical protein
MCNDFADRLMKDYKVDKFNYLTPTARRVFYDFVLKLQSDKGNPCVEEEQKTFPPLYQMGMDMAYTDVPVRESAQAIVPIPDDCDCYACRQARGIIEAEEDNVIERDCE